MIDESRSSDDDIDISDIINWDEAMEQVGGDEEFLKELLNDLQEELSAQVSKLYVAMQPVQLMSIRSAAHVVKGAAANLFCEELRAAAYGLEMVAKDAPADAPPSPQLKADLEEKFQIFKNAAKTYEKTVQNILSEPELHE